MGYASQTCVYYAAFAIIGMATASFGPGIPGFAENTGAAASQVGLLFIYQRIGYICGSLGAGRLMDKRRGNRFLAVQLFFLSGMAAALPFAGSLFLLFGISLLLGLAQGAIEVGGNTGIIKLHGAKSGPWMTGLHLAFGAGAIISPLLMSGFLYYASSARPAFWLLAALAVLAGAFTFRLPDTDSMRRASCSVFRKAPLFTAAVAVFFVFTVAGQLGFTGWIYSYALGANLEDKTSAGILSSVYWGALTFGRLCGILCVARTGTRRLLVLTSAGSALSAVVFLLFPQHRWALWLTALLLGLSQASILPTALTFAGEQKILSGFVAGIFTASTSLGGMVFPPLIGKLMQTVGLWTLPAVITATQGMAFVFILVILRMSASRVRNSK
jgi:fucose permease